MRGGEERLRIWERGPSFSGSLPDNHNSCGCQAEAKSLEFNPHLAQEYEGAKYLSHHLLSYRVLTNRKLELEAKLDFEYSYSSMGFSIPRSMLNVMPNVCASLLSSLTIHLPG